MKSRLGLLGASAFIVASAIIASTSLDVYANDGGGFSRGGSASFGGLSGGRERESVDTDQQGATDHQNNDTNNYYTPPAAGYYPPLPKDLQDDDDWDSGSAAVGLIAELPCAAQTEIINDMTYHLCGQDYYMEAYGSQGLVYMPVSPLAR